MKPKLAREEQMPRVGKMDEGEREIHAFIYRMGKPWE